MKKITLLILFLALGLVSLSCGATGASSGGAALNENAANVEKVPTPEEKAKARKIIDELKAKYPVSAGIFGFVQDVQAKLDEVSKLDPSYFQPLADTYWRTDERPAGNANSTNGADTFGLDISYLHLYPNGAYEAKYCFGGFGKGSQTFFYYLDPPSSNLFIGVFRNDRVSRLVWDGTKIADPPRLTTGAAAVYAPFVRLTKAQYDAVQSDADCPP